METYLKLLGSTNDGLYNPLGRGFPDVSALGTDVEIISGGQHVIISGTEVSAPVFASVISLINDELITAGLSPLGFLNPFFYSQGGTAFRDIVTGMYRISWSRFFRSHFQ